MEKKQIYAIAIVAIIVVAAIAGAVVLLNKSGSSSKHINTLDDLNGATIGTIKGYTGDTMIMSAIKNGDLTSDTKVHSYTSGALAVEALKSGHIDCVVIDQQPAKEFVKINSGLKILETEYAQEQYALAVKKGNTDLHDQINSALATLKDNGTLKQIEDYYYNGEGQSYQKKDIERDGTIQMITYAYFPPYESFKDGGDAGAIVGFDVDLMWAVCDILGMDLSIRSMEFNTLIGVLEQSNNSDNYVIAAGMTVTDERSKQVDFTDTYTTSIQVVIAKA